MLKLYYAPTSPFVRKVLAVAAELGLAGQVEKIPAQAHPVDRSEFLAACNPLGKIPAAVTADGLVLYDSRVICEYLDAHANGVVFPHAGRARWTALMQQALGDGIMDAALLARYELTARPPEARWPRWREAQLAKVRAGLAELERQVDDLASHGATIGSITLACALGYLDFRYAEIDWRADCPRAAQWFSGFDAHPAMAATRPREAA